MQGWPCFVVSIAAIGVCTAVIGDVAAQFGCFTLMKDTVSSITIVALGTSVPGKLFGTVSNGTHHFPSFDELSQQLIGYAITKGRVKDDSNILQALVHMTRWSFNLELGLFFLHLCLTSCKGNQVLNFQVGLRIHFELS